MVASVRTGMLLAGGLMAAAAISCSSATPTGTPGVSRLGKTVLQYQGAEVDATLSYRFADTELGADWLLLDAALTGNSRVAVEVKRENISLRTPAGEEVPLPAQDEFGQAYRALAATVQRANVAAEPLDYWAGREPCSLGFLTAPGEGLALLSVWVNDQRVCQGRLFFPLPQGVEAGRYELRIKLPESEVRIPFRLGENE
ncbi:MAG: hypothetical protein V1750_06900 [Acidobacteriota bacterium]